MRNYFFRIKFRLLFSILLFAGSGIHAQVYPVQVTVIPTPPHRNYLNSFSEQGALNVFLTLTDFNSGPISVKLKMELNGPGYQFRSLPNNLVYVLNPGQPTQVPMEDLAVFFSSTGQTLNFNPQKLPEGNTSICIDVIKNQSGEVLSQNGCGYFYMGYGQPASLLQPACNATVQIPAGYPASTDLRTLPLQFNFIPALAPIGLQQEVENTLYIYNWLGTVNTNPPLTPNGLALAMDPIELGPITAHTLLPINNQLIVGQEYVWYVKTSLNGSTNQFQNGGWSAPCKFKYGAAQSVEEALANGLSVEWVDLVSNSESKGTGTWKVVKEDPNSSATFNQFILKYRRKVPAGQQPFEWFSDTVNDLSKAIYQLEPATTYEASVAGRLGSFVSEPTEIRTFTTAPPRTYSCGVANFPGRATAFQPLEYADPGMKVKIGMFQMEFVSVQNTGQPGHFSGTGLIPVDFLFGAEARVKFDNLKIDKEYDVWEGTAHVITDGLDAWLEDQYQQFQDPIFVNGTVDSAYVSDSIAHVIIDGVDTTFTFPCATCPVVINDVAGNQVTIYPNGTVIWSSYLDVSDEQLDVPDTEIGVFEQHAQETGGFDPFEHIEWNANYEIIRTSNAVNYFVANKSMHEGVADKVNVVVPKNKYGPNDVQLSWDGLTTPLEPTSNSVNGDDRIFTFDLPEFDAATIEIYAKKDEDKIGKLNLFVYEILERDVVIIPLDEIQIDQTEMELYINKSIGEAGVKLTVSISDTIGVSLYQNETFNIPDATLMIKYGPEMRKVIDTYFDSHDYMENAYYIFAVAGLQDTVNNASVDGYMVRGKSIGFISTAASLHTIAHELGHGMGALQHSWQDNGPSQTTTTNLMDYGNGTNLILNQWEGLRNPSDGSFWDDESDAENANHIAYYFWEENDDHSIKMQADSSFVNRSVKSTCHLSGYYDGTIITHYRYDLYYRPLDLEHHAKSVKSFLKVKFDNHAIRYKKDIKVRSNLLVVKNMMLKDIETVYPDRKQYDNNYVVYFNYTQDHKLYFSHTSHKLTLKLTGYSQPVYDHMYVIRDMDGSEIVGERVYDFTNDNIPNKPESTLNSRFVKSKVLNIYVNGYIYNMPGTTTDDCQPLGPYWRDAWSNEEQYILASKEFLNPGKGTAYEYYLNGTGDSYASSASSRRSYASGNAPNVISALKKLIKGYAKQGDTINEINIISHSMGAAVAEGYIDKFMGDTLLRRLLKNGEIVHFSACDGDAIDIYYKTELKRCQVNYKGDVTLGYADSGPVANVTGGYGIDGITKRAVVMTNFSLYNDGATHDPHFDSKAFDDAWIAVKLLYQSSTTGWLPIEHTSIRPTKE